MDHNIVFNAGDAHPKHDWKHERDHGFRSFHSARPLLFHYTIRELVKGGSVVSRM